MSPTDLFSGWPADPTHHPAYVGGKHWQFVSAEELQSFLGFYFPGAEALDIPGAYTLPDGRELSVLNNTITVHF